MEERKRRFSKQEHIYPEIRTRLGKMVGRGCFGGVHFFTPSGDIPDDFELHLCVLTPDVPHTRCSNLATDAAESILKKHGDQPRQYQNRLIFQALDADSLARLRGQVRSYLSWTSILSDIEALKLNLDMLQINQARQFVEQASPGLNRMSTECYRWILCPVQPLTPTQTPGNLTWEPFTLNGSDKSMAAKIEEKLLAEVILIKQWSPIYLDQLLKAWFWKEERNDINTLTVWKSLCDYLYMPRLINAAVFLQAVSQGVQSGDYFGYADGKEGDTYRGLKLGLPATAVVDKSSLLIRIEAAKEALSQKLSQEERAAAGNDVVSEGVQKADDPSPSPKPPLGAENKSTVIKRFYGTGELDPHTGRIDYDQIHEEIIALLTSKPGNVVTLRLDIEARSPDGFDANIQRAILENSNTLKFDDAKFE
jgi:hypothetical protein